jgi:hypothetical protein
VNLFDGKGPEAAAVVTTLDEREHGIDPLTYLQDR